MIEILDIEVKLSSEEWALHASILLAAFILFVSARPLLGMFRDGIKVDRRVRVFRSFIVLFVVLQAVDIILLHGMSDYENAVFNLGKSILFIYFSTIFYNIASNWAVKRFGKHKKVDGNDSYIATYYSRMADIVAIILLSLITLYFLIEIWNLDNMLQTTGIFGVFFAFLALTNGIWAPDIYYGLVILNCNQLEDGDTFYMHSDKTMYIVHRINFVYTILLNVQNNHRTIIRNSRLFQGRVENLTKRASMDGLRASIDYKIGYPLESDIPVSERNAVVNDFKNRTEKMFSAAESELQKIKGTHLRSELGLEWHLDRVDDFALVYRLSYYLEVLPSTRLARKVREQLNGAQSLVNETVYKQSVLHDIHLETPMLLQRI